MTPLRIAQLSPRVQDALFELRDATVRLRDPQLKAAVEGLLADPAPTFLGATSSFFGFEAAAGGAWSGGHHAYPGGLAVHTWANLRHAWSLVDEYRDLYGMTLDKDLVTAAVICHDVLKSWTNQFWPRWDARTGAEYVPPEVAPGGPYAAWGAFGLMDHHNALIASELMHRHAPPRLVFTAISHVDQSLDDRAQGFRRQTDETWERTFEDASRWLEQGHPGESAAYRSLYAGGHYLSFEAGVNWLSDADWNLTQGRAAPLAQHVFDAFAGKFALVPGTAAYGLARDWAYAHQDPMRLAQTALASGSDAAEALVEEAFR